MKYKIHLIDIQTDAGKKLQSRYSFWHDPEFMAALADLHGVRALQLQVFKGEELLAILPLYERRKLGFKALVTPTGTYYQGISFDFPGNCTPTRKLLDTVAISARIADFLTEQYKWIDIQLNPDNVDIRGFTWAGYKAKVFYTFRQFLGTELPVLADERYTMRQAEKQGMKMVEEFNPDAFLTLQKGLEERKQHSLGVSHDRLKDFFIRLHEKGLLKQLNVYHDSKIVSSSILYVDQGEVAYLILMATTPEAMRLGAAIFNSLSLADHLPEPTQILDFCGANIREVARFKAAIGLDLQSFFHLSI